uniref:Prenyltransferase alpha-alpha toroid domain-containing protein n=1 Tax=Oryza meridionalis TaxID=40149 RepID=A0A0E0BX60_9ORYZ
MADPSRSVRIKNPSMETVTNRKVEYITISIQQMLVWKIQGPAMAEPEQPEFARERHVLFLEAMASELPADYASQEVNHLTLAYFAVAGLSLLRELDSIVGYDLANIDNKVLLSSMRNLQQPDGSFMPTHIGAETDLRFVYCAAAICSMLKDWTGMDKEKAKQYILSCQSYDGGFGLVPGSESHGGGTFCAVAALCLMGFIQVDLASNLQEPSSIDVRLLLEWCLQRQAADGGFQGRRNKSSDTCYAFWIGGVLKIIGAYRFIDHGALRSFLLYCQSPYGGFTKFLYDQFPDIYHSYYGLAALSLLEEEGLEPLCTELGILSAAL